MSELDRIKALAGLATDTVAEAGCDCECGQSPCEACGEDHHEVAEAVGEKAEAFYDMQDAFAGGEAEGAHKVIIDELVRYLSGDQLEDFVADFSRHYDLADMDVNEDDLDENAFNQAAAKAKQAGKDHFMFNGKKYKVSMDKETAEDLTEEPMEFEDEDVCDKCDMKADECECDHVEETLEEGRMKDSVIHDSETMSKEEFAKKHGKELADEMYESQESDEEVVSEAPTMDTTQLITLLKNAGLTEEAIEEKLTEWANTPAPEMAGEQEPTEHGDAYDFAQSVNLSLKRYLDAEDMKVGLKEHKVEDIREAYEAKKNK